MKRTEPIPKLLDFSASFSVRERVESRIRKGLLGRVGNSMGYSDRWLVRIRVRPSNMNLADYLLFRVLHRHFEGRVTPFLPLLVKSLRSLFYYSLPVRKLLGRISL